ncbi:hypothetical protein [Mameliella sp.]
MLKSRGLTRRSLLATGAGALAVPFLARPGLAATTLRYGHNNEVASVAGT